MAPRTMPAYSPRTQAALLKASNRLFDVDTGDSLEGFADGAVLANILHELDSSFNPATELETSRGPSRLTNKKNIEVIYRALFRYIRRSCPELRCQAKKIKCHAIAENPDPQGVSQLLSLMVTAAALGRDNQKYVPRIQNSLDRDTQTEIMQIIRAMQMDVANAKDDDDDMGDDDDGAINAVMEARDVELLMEEQNTSLRQQLDVTKKTLSDYITRLEYLQQSHEELKFEKEKNDRELEVLRKATQDGANSAESIRILEAQVHEQMEIIARNEESIRTYERQKAVLEGEVQKLLQRSDQVDALRDQLSEWKHKADEYEKKANMAERYKQKLESQQHLAKEVDNLRYEKAELAEQLKSLADNQEKSARIKKAEDELTKMITQSEQHLWDERNQKNQLIRDISSLEEELVRLKAQRTHDEHFIQDLQEQLQQGGGGTSSAQEDIVGPSATSLNLEDELNGASEDDGQVNLPLELSRLKAENDILRSTVGSTGDLAILRRDLDEEKRQRARLQQDFNELFEKFVITQDQNEALMKNMTDEGTQAFVNLKTQLMQANFELEQGQKREKDMEIQLTDSRRELVRARSQISAMEKGGVEAVDEIKNTDNLISKTLETNLIRLRADLNYTESQRDAQRLQLAEVLLEKERLRKEAEESKEAHDSLTTSSGDADGSEKNELVGKLRDRLRERQQQLEKSEHDKIEIQRKLKAALDGEASAAQKTARDQIIKNLQRENALISTAWYDLISRLQSNHVVLQRRQDAPKSWLNKQRQMVNGQLRRRDSLYLY